MLETKKVKHRTRNTRTSRIDTADENKNKKQHQ